MSTKNKTLTIPKPMLAAAYDAKKASFPLLASYKLDGIRCLIYHGVAYSRSGKPLPNRQLQDWAASRVCGLHGLDGEIIVGDPTAKDVFKVSHGFCMKADRTADFSFHAFDRFTVGGGLRSRLTSIHAGECGPRMVKVGQVELTTAREVELLAGRAVSAGYEGLILRSPSEPYKHGRSTVKEQGMLKVKLFEDAEAVIVGFEEAMHNGNEKYKDEVGNTKRSTHQENKTGKGELGALVVRMWSKDKVTSLGDVEFRIGTGFDADERLSIWANQDHVKGQIVKFKYQPCGTDVRPRSPVFLGFRDKIDL